MNPYSLPPDIGQRVNAELQPGESIVWAGQPVPRLMARGTLPVMIFAIPWTAFAVFWMFGAAGFKVPTFRHGEDVLHLLFPMFGLPFVLIGLGMLSSPFWARRRAKKMAYVITNQRAFTITPGFWGSQTVRSYEPDALVSIERKERPDGSGDLIFERNYSSNGNGNGQVTAQGFLGLEEVKQVERLVLQLSRAGSGK